MKGFFIIRVIQIFLVASPSPMQQHSHFPNVDTVKMADSTEKTADSHHSPNQLHTSAAGTNTTPDTNAVQEVQANANLSATDIGNTTITNGQPTINTVTDLTNNTEREATITKNEKYIVHLCTINEHGALHSAITPYFREAVSRSILRHGQVHLLATA